MRTIGPVATALPMRGRLRRMHALCAVAALLLLPASPAAANDSTASLDAGGLRLTFNPHIRMESEDLYLSRTQVRVVYRFHNAGAHDIDTLVAFPLPVMEIGEGGNYALDGRDAANVMDFQVTVDGRPVAPAVQVKATRFGVDVTDVLERHGIPPTMLSEDPDALNARVSKLPAAARSELERYGVIDWSTSFGANNEPLANPHWEAHVAFYWFQSFPAGRTIEVTHRYRPVPRQFFFGNDDLASSEKKKAYCIDAALVRSARARIQQASQQALAGYELRYVLTTAGNWSGPIRSFRLTVEKSSPDALLSMCAKGIKRTSPTSFSVSRENFSPDEDLKVLFLESLKDGN